MKQGEKLLTGPHPVYPVARRTLLHLFNSVLVIAWTFILNYSAYGAVDWPVLGYAQIVTNTFNYPVGITHAGDGSQRLFVTEKAGRVWIIQNSNVLAQPFLDMTNRVLSASGMLGLAFPPGFATNGHVYVCYARQSDSGLVVSRFHLSADPHVVDTNSEQLILLVGSSYSEHNGGQLAFGPDGHLYIGTGDGGPEGDTQNRAQNPLSLQGKLLRIDVEGGSAPYAVPASNPFFGQAGYRPEIWALGLRNPKSFAFDRLTGGLFIGDVGPMTAYQEIDFQPAASPGGENYGWRIMQGPTNFNVPPGFTNFSALTLPVACYDLTGLPNCVVEVAGGRVYRGPDKPRLNGVYVYGDPYNGWLWGMKREGTNWQSKALVSPSSYQSTNIYLSVFGEDEQGDLYVADRAPGKIYRLQDNGAVWTPVFSPGNGILYSNIVVVTCLSTNAEIHYTTNGVDPTLSDPAVASGGTITVASGLTNKARAFRADLSPSGIARAIFTNKVATPTFSPAPGAVSNGTLVAISTLTPGATLYYTTNGTAPTTNSSVYASPIAITRNLTIKSMGACTGYSTSAVATAAYTLAPAATPVFAPASGPITNGTRIAISCSTPGSTIHYTLDGNTPTTNSAVYTGPITINGGTTVKAFAVASAYLDGSVRSVFYSLVQTETPVFTPASGPLDYGATIAVSCATPGSVIYCSLDGSPPTTNSALYSSPFTITHDFTLSAFAVSPEHLDSPARSVQFTLTKVASPIFNPAYGPLTAGTLISMQCPASDAVIRYTVDGTDPDTNSTSFSTPLVFSVPTRLKARAFASHFDPSDVTSNFFGLLDFENTVVTTFAGSPTPGLTNGQGMAARFFGPQGICLNGAGSFYVADSSNNIIRKITPAGVVTTFAGTGVAGDALGEATNAQFRFPTDVCLDSAGNVIIADCGNCNRICRVGTDGIVTKFAEVTSCSGGNYAGALWQIECGPDGNIYVSYWFGIRKIFPDGTVQLFAGTGCNCPGGWGMNVGIGIDAQTNVYGATGGNLWKTAANGLTDLFAGGIGTFSDGPRQLSGFGNLRGAFLDPSASANFFLSDATRIRKVDGEGWVTTLAGTGVAGYRNGRGSEAQFNSAAGLCVDTNGNIYVADTGNNCIRKIAPDTAGVGMADDWQRLHFGTVGIDPNADPDHDGASNFAEFWAGTDPLDPDSVLSIDRASLFSNGQFRIRWQTAAGKTYTVQISTNLASWTTLGSTVLGDGTIASVIDADAISQNTQRYYRVMLTGY